MPSQRETYEPIARQAALAAGIDPDAFVRQITHESGWDPDAESPAGAVGLAQIVAKFHPDVDPHDPVASLNYAAGWMGRMYKLYGSYRKALAAYNWGPGNVSNWDGQRATLPAETQRYLDVILGPSWAEPSGAGAGVAATAGGGGAPASGTSPDATIHFRVARVSPDRLNLRADPSTSAQIVDHLDEGTLLEPLGPARDADGLTWLQVQLPDGTQGWAATQYLDLVAAAPDGEQPSAPGADPTSAAAGPSGQPDGSSDRYRVNTDSVRLREQPGTDATILASLRSGTLVDDDGATTVSASGYDWRRVRVDGQTGWVATQFLSPATAGRLQFDPTIPTELQVQAWTCSIRSTMWILKSIGVAVTPEQAQDAMSPRYVNSDLGLLDASGAGIVAVLQDVWGVTAFNRAPVSFDEVAGWAGRYPVAIGGRAWGHWTAVRGLDANGNLVLANPGGTGPRYGQQTLDRQQFADLGWFSAVVIPTD
jgi:uncharacterized protein YraI